MLDSVSSLLLAVLPHLLQVQLMPLLILHLLHLHHHHLLLLLIAAVRLQILQSLRVHLLQKSLNQLSRAVLLLSLFPLSLLWYIFYLFIANLYLSSSGISYILFHLV